MTDLLLFLNLVLLVVILFRLWFGGAATNKSVREEFLAARTEQAARDALLRTEIASSSGQSIERLQRQMSEAARETRETLDKRLNEIRTDNGAKLEQMRQTVDEKLQGTLNARLGESFKLVSDQLNRVHQGLGEMQTLAASVGDLKRVFTNVKIRGTWGEFQLSSLLEQLLTPDQYAANVATAGGYERVEYAIRLPEGVWLPIDAKFPLEDYQRLIEASERGDPEGTEVAAKALENRLKKSARDIAEKYVAPPLTTDFAILYLPTEGLYAEALRRTGLQEFLQREHRVTLAGPTTLAALLNSLQMGFRTLTIQQKSSEVWQVLGRVKTEFAKYGAALDKVKKKLQEATNTVDAASQRTRVLTSRLEGVETVSLPFVLEPPDEDEEFTA